MTPEENAKRNRESYHWNADHGICACCGQTWADPGHVYCRTCAKKKRAMNKRADPTGEKSIARKRATREYRKANGLCYDCGKPTGGKCRCPTCAKKNGESWKVWSIKQKLKKRA